jgi:SpoVK/Ycf46/Vps4 family AAA+-type ATPase
MPGTLIQHIRSYVESHYPMLYLVTSEDVQADDMIAALADGRKLMEWNMARGLVRFDNKLPYIESDYKDLPAALLHMLEQDYTQQVIVIRDAHLALRDNPLAVARLKALAAQAMHREDAHITIFLVASVVFIPPELEKVVTLFDVPLPDEASILGLIQDMAQVLECELDEGIQKQLALSLQGLSPYEIRQLLKRSYQSSGEIGLQHIDLIQDEKAQIIQKNGALELIKSQESLDGIGGLRSLKLWLRQKQKVLADWTAARAFGVEIPKGVMVVGMPGCGKSLTAKATASLFRLPLLKLDMGSMMGKYVGESEGNMRRALKVADAVSPCVLWVDEVEKAFAGIGSGGSGSEVATRMFGYFLTWMQEKTSQVFVIATANDIACLPPELLRKGRFDEIFYVDFPAEAERKEIFRLHLQKRGKLTEQLQLDVNQLASATKDYSGADIESIVKDAIEAAFVDGKKDLTTALLQKTIQSTQPLGEVMKDKVKEYKDKFERMKIKKAA